MGTSLLFDITANDHVKRKQIDVFALHLGVR